MFWNRFSCRDADDRAEQFRRTHEAWLDWAIRSGRRFPRIPLRRVEEGGFDPLRRRPGGRARAAAWWRLALDRVIGPIG